MSTPAFLLDEMLGKLARELRALGYDAAYAHGSEDDEILERAREEERVLVTRDRQLADRAGSQALLLETREPGEQLDHLVDRLQLSPTADAFLSRCLECNELVEPVDAPDDVPDGLEDARHRRCPSCERVYWPGTHVEDMLDRLGRHLPEGTRRDDVFPEENGERKP